MKEIEWDKKGRCYKIVDTKRKVRRLKPTGGLERIFSQHCDLSYGNIKEKAEGMSEKPDYYEVLLPEKRMDEWGYYTYIIKFYKKEGQKNGKLIKQY